MYKAPQYFGITRATPQTEAFAEPPAPAWDEAGPVIDGEVIAAPPPEPIEACEPSDLPEPAPPRRRWRWLRRLTLLAVWGGLALCGLLVWFIGDLPRPDSAAENGRRPSLTLLDRAGRSFATFGDLVGEPLHLADLPPWLPKAVISVEDRRFYSHFGLDPIGIARATWVNLRAGRVVQGGSTITQQVAKTLFLSNARTFRRKVQEILLTLWLERHFSKDQILEIWLNRVYLGAGAWGVDAAARTYFGVSARRLNMWQCAVLAGLPRAPSRYSPRNSPVAAAARAREVLAAMVAADALTEEQAARASRQIGFVRRTGAGAAGDWFADWAGPQSEARLPEGEDATARTTVDAALQASVQRRLTGLLDGPGAAADVGQGAVVVMETATGAVRAMVGGHDRRASSFNRAALARRQAGSAFKPFVWLAALEAGLTPETIVADAPITIGDWSPANYDGTFHGDVTMETGLAKSLNTVAVRLMQKAGGPRRVAIVARRLGVMGELPDNVTIALGTGDVGLLELVAAYASFCNGGLLPTPTGIDSVTVAGRTSEAAHLAPDRVMSAEHAAMMARMMQAVVARGTGRAAAIPGRLIAGKTGTTQEYKDAWFVGCILDGPGAGHVIGVWLGNDDNQPMRNIAGGTLPARLFHDIALDLH